MSDFKTASKSFLPAGKDGWVHGSWEEHPLENAGSPLVEPECGQDEGQEACDHREDEDVVIPEIYDTLYPLTTSDSTGCPKNIDIKLET